MDKEEGGSMGSSEGMSKLEAKIIGIIASNVKPLDGVVKVDTSKAAREVLAAIVEWGKAYCTDHHPYHKHRHECSGCWRAFGEIGTYIGECEDCGFEKQHYGDFEVIICDRCGGSIKNKGLAQRCPECNTVLNAHGICSTCEACRADLGFPTTGKE